MSELTLSVVAVSFALGYLYSDIQADLELEDAKRLARKAVEIASVLDVNTGKPLQLVVQERII
jgi:20S proteasome alpha/beta subunit